MVFLNSRSKWVIKSIFYKVGFWRAIEFARHFLRFIFRKPHEIDFSIFSKIGNAEGLFLDIGANAGQSAISFRMYNQSYQILSLEPNPLMKKDLRILKLFLSKFDFMPLGVSDSSNQLKLFVPFVGGMPLTQEGTIHREILETDLLTRKRIAEMTGKGKFEVSEFSLNIVTVDSLSLKPDIVKLDVQGAELEAIRGMRETIKRSRPILMLECGVDTIQIGEYLAGMEYSSAYAFFPKENRLAATPSVYEHPNVFFLPKERLSELALKNWF